MSERYAVIMAGGVGSRFWPMSTPKHPKQFLAISPCETPMLKQSVDRLSGVIDSSRIYIVTGRDYASLVKETVPQIPQSQLLLEPVGRNTAPCIAWATSLIHERDPDALVGVFAADHLIRDVSAFRECVASAYDVAHKGAHIVTLGIKAHAPETGYGYIECGEQYGEQAHVFHAARFVEKPSLALAKTYLQEGCYVWNSGMFFFKTKSMLAELQAHVPSIAQSFESMLALPSAQRQMWLDAHFANLKALSIDYAVMEKSKEVLVIPGSFGWSDLGSFASSWEQSKGDADGNVSNASRTYLQNSARNLIQSMGNKRVALIDVDDLIVIETDDALLVTKRDSAQAVKHAAAWAKDLLDEQ